MRQQQRPVSNNMADTVAADKRFMFLEQFVLNTLKLKQDKWVKCMGVDDYRLIIQEFFDRPEHLILIFSLNSGQMLVPK